MINRNKMAASSLAVIGLIAVSSPTLAGFYELAPNEDINVCVAEIRENVDYTGAGRVRHEVDSKKRRSVGYSLKIDTTVFSEINGEVISEYKAVCVVIGGKTPFRFTIEKSGDDA